MRPLYSKSISLLGIIVIAVAVSQVDWPSQSENRGETAVPPQTADEILHRFGLSPSVSPIPVEARGREFHWSFRYPGPDQLLSTPDDVLVEDQLHLPDHMPVQLTLESDDYLYFLSCPSLNLREMAMRGVKRTLLVNTNAPRGVHSLVTDPMCGLSQQHDDSMGNLVIESPMQFCQWARSQYPPANPTN